MATAAARDFRAAFDAMREELATLPAELADTPWRTGGWTRKQIVGHLMDSATNNRQRFVRASIEGKYTGPSYQQEEWVAAHGYSEQTWDTLLHWWRIEHEILAAAVDRIPEEKLKAQCVVGDEQAVSLLFLMEDYWVHQRRHMAQMATGAR